MCAICGSKLQTHGITNAVHLWYEAIVYCKKKETIYLWAHPIPDHPSSKGLTRLRHWQLRHGKSHGTVVGSDPGAGSDDVQQLALWKGNSEARGGLSNVASWEIPKLNGSANGKIISKCGEIFEMSIAVFYSVRVPEHKQRITWLIINLASN